MFLSICIPVYNEEVANLVQPLQHQIFEQDLQAEIVVLDDGSKPSVKEINRSSLAKFPDVVYQELPQNIGRSAIRNRLAIAAKGEYLLFLDNDVSVPSDFIERYLEVIDNTDQIIFLCGGIKYPDNKPNKKQTLRWQYGRKVEQIRYVDQKIISPVMGANMLISAIVFEHIQFDESIKTYGFEDVLFAQDYEHYYHREVIIIDNPVTINHLDSNHEFIQKTQEAMENLADLVTANRLPLYKNLRLLIAYNQLHNNKLVQPFIKLTQSLEPSILFNLISNNPSIKLFQLYKLFLFARAFQSNLKMD